MPEYIAYLVGPPDDELNYTFNVCTFKWVVEEKSKLTNLQKEFGADVGTPFGNCCPPDMTDQESVRRTEHGKERVLEAWNRKLYCKDYPNLPKELNGYSMCRMIREKVGGCYCWMTSRSNWKMEGMVNPL